MWILKQLQDISLVSKHHLRLKHCLAEFASEWEMSGQLGPCAALRRLERKENFGQSWNCLVDKLTCEMVCDIYNIRGTWWYMVYIYRSVCWQPCNHSARGPATGRVSLMKDPLDISVLCWLSRAWRTWGRAGCSPGWSSPPSGRETLRPPPLLVEQPGLYLNNSYNKDLGF